MGLGPDISEYTDFDSIHNCRYYVMRKTVKHFANGRVWAERCNCGRSKEVDYKFIVEGSKFPKRTIRWYDNEGNLERITGDV